MRIFLSYFILPLFTLGALACGGNETGNNSSSSSSSSSGSSSSSSGSGGDGSGGNGSGGNGSGGGSGGGSATGITGTAKNIFRPTTGEQILPRSSDWTSIEAIVGEGAARKSYPGSIDAEGNISIPDVPDGPYQLVLTSPPPANDPSAKPAKTVVVTDARVLDLGRIMSHRSDLKSMTQSTFLSISANLSVPWQAYTEDGQGNVIQPLDDELIFMSQNASAWGGWSSTGTPQNGDTQFSNWSEDIFGMLIGFGLTPNPLIEGSKGDELAILHGVRHSVGMATPDGNPWNGHTFMAVEESFTPAPFTMTDGGTSMVSGDFKAVPQKMFALDYKGSAWNALLTGIPRTLSYLDMSIYYEPGAPEPAIGTIAYLLSSTVNPGLVYSNPDPACQGANCDLGVCATQCDPGMDVLPGDYAHTYAYGNPFSDGQELANFYFYFQNRVTQLLPDTTSERVRGAISVLAPPSELSGKAIMPVVSFPTGIKVGGKDTPYDQVTAGVGVMPMISWSAPAMGTPTHYSVRVVDLTDKTLPDMTTQRRRNVAFITTKGTSAEVPEGVMEAGRHYYFEVTAQVQDNDDLAKPFYHSSHSSYAQIFTGIVTP